MKAVILAAGKSSRLYPLTTSLPKCLLPVGNKTILDYQMEALVANKVSDVTIVIGFEKEQIIAHLAKQNYPISIIYIENDDFASTGPTFGLFLARSYLSEPVLFLHCDVLLDRTAISTLLHDPHDSVFLYRKGAWDEEAGKVIVDTTTGRVRELGKHIEKERATGEYLQIAKFGQDFVNHLGRVVDERIRGKRDGYTIDAFNDVVQDESVTVLGLPFEGNIMEIDTPEDYETAKETWNKIK